MGLVGALLYVVVKTRNQSFEKKCKKRLKNRNFTILCSNCIGGIIYHRLGLRFQTPTIALWMRQYDFINFISNPQNYLNQDLRFIKTEEPTPVALLGSDNPIQIHFNHANSEMEAEEAWIRRKNRIDYNNLYIIMYDRDNLTREQLASLATVKCKRLIVLTERDDYADLDYVLKIKKSRKDRPNSQVFLDQDLFGIRTFEKQFDFVGWLNGSKY